MLDVMASTNQLHFVSFQNIIQPLSKMLPKLVWFFGYIFFLHYNHLVRNKKTGTAIHSVPVLKENTL